MPASHDREDVVVELHEDGCGEVLASIVTCTTTGRIHRLDDGRELRLRVGTAAELAQECIVHLGAISYEILRRDLPPLESAGGDGRRVILPVQVSHADFVAAAFDEIRQSAVPLPSVGAALVETLAEVLADLAEDGITERDRTDPLVRQARLVLAGVEKAGPLPEDAARLRDAAAALFHGSHESSSGAAPHHVG